MARTKADIGKKAGGKAPRKAPVLRTTSSPRSGGVSKRKKGSGGSRNSVCKRPTPKWQVPIEEFLTKAGSSKESSSTPAADADTAANEIEIIEDPAASSTAACGNSAHDSEGEFETMEDEANESEDDERDAAGNAKVEGSDQNGTFGKDKDVQQNGRSSKNDDGLEDETLVEDKDVQQNGGSSKHDDSLEGEVHEEDVEELESQDIEMAPDNSSLTEIPETLQEKLEDIPDGTEKNSE